MDKKLRIGVIGCGGIANGKHMPAYKANRRSDMVAFCDIVEERAIKAQKDFGAEGSYYCTDYKKVLADKSIDAVLVLTHNSEHCHITVDALNAGKHVMCEKPMAMNYAEAKKMIAARDKSGKVLTVGYQNRYRQDSLYLKRLADSGKFGEIYYAEATAIRRRGVPTWGVFIEEEKQGGGPLIDIGTHALDLTLFIMNNYEPAYCLGKTYHKLNKQTETGNSGGDWNVDKFTAEDCAFGMVVMKNGATIIVRSSWALNYIDTKEAVTLVCGEKGGADMPAQGALRINGVECGKMYVAEPNLKAGGVDYFPGATGLPHELEAECFLRACFGEGKLYVTADQAAVVTRILEGIYESQKTGKMYVFD